MPIRRTGALAWLMATQFFYAWGWSTGDVLRPQFRAALGLSLTQAGSGYSAQVVGAVTGAWLLSGLARRSGAAMALATMTAGYGAALIAGVWVTSWPQLIVQRFAFGLFAGGVFPVTVAVYVALYAATARGRAAAAVDACYYAAVIGLGLALGRVAPGDWLLLLWLGGAPALLLAPAALIAIPPIAVPLSPAPRGGLLARGVRGKTVTLVAMMGANSFGYQSFIGWLTVYLVDARGFAASQTGTVIAMLYSANVAGTAIWGWAVDRWGRRAGAFGPLLCASAIALFLGVTAPPVVMGAIAALYGLGFAATVCLGPWIAEMFPEEQRLAATSLFQWGRFISLFTPLITATLAKQIGLGSAMACGVGAFVLSLLLWRRLPETLNSAGSAAPNRAPDR